MGSDLGCRRDRHRLITGYGIYDYDDGRVLNPAAFLLDASALVSTSPSGNFNHLGSADADDLAQWQGDFGVNGDSDADNDHDGADFLVWQRQLGMANARVATEAVPEPAGTFIVIGGVLAAFGRRRSRRPWVFRGATASHEPVHEKYH